MISITLSIVSALSALTLAPQTSKIGLRWRLSGLLNLYNNTPKDTRETLLKFDILQLRLEKTARVVAEPLLAASECQNILAAHLCSKSFWWRVYLYLVWRGSGLLKKRKAELTKWIHVFLSAGIPLSQPNGRLYNFSSSRVYTCLDTNALQSSTQCSSQSNLYGNCPMQFEILRKPSSSCSSKNGLISWSHAGRGEEIPGSIDPSKIPSFPARTPVE